MKNSEKSRVQKAITQIQDGNFNENEVVNLFTPLRPYLRDSYIFKEVADLIAHNNKRDQGVAHESLENFYNTFKYLSEYPSPSSLNLLEPFPLYVKKLMHHQVNKCNESVLKARYKITKQRLNGQIASDFTEDKKNQTACLKHRKINSVTDKATRFVMHTINSEPICNQEELINEIITVLRKHGLRLDEAKFRSQESKITLCILLLFHKIPFYFKGQKFGDSKIFCDPSCIVNHEGTFGNLEILGTITFDEDEKKPPSGYTLLSTNLKVEDWCDETVFSIKPLSQDRPDLLGKCCVDLDSDLVLNDDFKLSKISP